jgi:hypothetical protein
MAVKLSIKSKQLPTNRKFGLFFAALFSMLAFYSYFQTFIEIALLASILTILFTATAIKAPHLLSPLNHFWYELGLLLGKITSPIVLGIIFFLLITPISIISRLFGRDELKMKKKAVDSYWIYRNPSGPHPDSFKNQY